MSAFKKTGIVLGAALATAVALDHFKQPEAEIAPDTGKSQQSSADSQNTALINRTPIAKAKNPPSTLEIMCKEGFSIDGISTERVNPVCLRMVIAAAEMKSSGETNSFVLPVSALTAEEKTRLFDKIKDKMQDNKGKSCAEKYSNGSSISGLAMPNTKAPNLNCYGLEQVVRYAIQRQWHMK